jgi:hypothetical protein
MVAMHIQYVLTYIMDTAWAFAYKDQVLRLEIMKSVPVDSCLKIFDILAYTNESLNINEICRRTGTRHKNTVINSIRLLEKAGLIRTDKQHGSSQKEFKLLTDDGREVDLLRNCIARYEESISKFRDAVNRNFDIDTTLPRSVIRNTLKARKWTDEEIDYYKETQSGMARFGQLSSDAFFVALSLRFLKLLFKSRNNKLRQTILHELFTKSLRKQLAIASTTRASGNNLIAVGMDDEQLVDDMITQASRTLFHYISQYIATEDYDWMRNRFIANEAQDLANCVYHTADPAYFEYLKPRWPRANIGGAE